MKLVTSSQEEIFPLAPIICNIVSSLGATPSILATFSRLFFFFFTRTHSIEGTLTKGRFPTARHIRQAAGTSRVTALSTFVYHACGARFSATRCPGRMAHPASLFLCLISICVSVARMAPFVSDAGFLRASALFTWLTCLSFNPRFARRYISSSSS